MGTTTQAGIEAILGDDGRVYMGTNVENASFGLSNCAERTAVFRAVPTQLKTAIGVGIGLFLALIG